ncbi:helicase associated domain-containing protein [Cryobacterium sp. PAMC25264]|uniref:helicase associated domain-containing protein n=1 Tax=Cryobacterium sp. PAMC25264 TaxID=2861288 RepID=UPI001C6303D2|nr:helicase associated domain-containing protein [Cryobacterium sp. PAMC25264]QYF74877.1 helicase associated domain-containing protein [Cryobacterium sp. PAMC25264]
MSELSPLEQLHVEYRQLQRQRPSRLTQDHVTSLTFFTADPTWRESGEIPARAPRGVMGWIHSVLALEDFVEREGRLPRENRRLPAGTISIEEKQRCNSVRAQRRAFAAGRLCSYQVQRLQCIDGFTFQPVEDAWQAHYDAYSRFTATHGDAPKLRSEMETERALARWAAKTRLAYRSGRLAPARVVALNALSFWTWGASNGK